MVPVVKNAKGNLIDILSTSEKHTVLYVYWHRQEGGVIHDTAISAYREFSLQFPSYRELIFLELNCSSYLETCNDFLKTKDAGLYFFPEQVVNVSGSLTIEPFNKTLVISYLTKLRGSSKSFEDLAAAFTRQKFMRTHQKESDSKVSMLDDEIKILTAAKNMVDKDAECIQFKSVQLCERFIKWMEYFVDKHSGDLGSVSSALNAANRKLGEVITKADYKIARIEIYVLNAFVKPLFG